MASAFAARAPPLGGTRAAIRGSPTVGARTCSCDTAAGAFSSRLSSLRGARVSASPHPRRVRRASKITPRAASLPPNKEWPPNDVWSEFRATHSGTWVGWAKRFAPNGAPIVSTSLENDNAVDEKTSGATDTAQWQRTVANSKFAGAGGIKEIDTLAIDTKYVEVGAVSATAGGVVGGKKKKKEKKKKKKQTRTVSSSLLAGGQMGKMCVAMGDYISGPVVLPECTAGTTVTFEAGFTIRVPDQSETNENYGDETLAEWEERFAKNELPNRRIRVFVEIEAVPGSKRNWRAVGFEMLVETKESGAEGKASKVEGKESTAGEGIEDASDASTRELSDALPRELIDTKTLGEDEIACGEWRATTGVTFLTTESLLDDAAYNEMWIDKFDKAREDEMMGVTLGGDVDAFDEDERDDGNEPRTGREDVSDSDGARYVDQLRARGGLRRKGRGRVVIKTDDATANSLDSSAGATDNEKEDSKQKETEHTLRAAFLSQPKPVPDGLVVVPTWAVAAKAPWTSAREYLIGGNSPLVLLPNRVWVLVESINGELLVEVGVYAGEGGLGEAVFDNETDGDAVAAPAQKKDPRRAVARRYERGGRFASAFFVEERAMSSEELEFELAPGEGDTPLTF